MKHHHLFICFILLSGACSVSNKASLEPQEMNLLTTATAEKGNLKAVFVDNQAFEPHHRAGYNGIAELYHTVQDSTVFVPSFSGFNLEHIFSGDSLEEFFEPRAHPMKLYRRNETEILLYQDTTPVSGAESLTEFKLVPPHYIDVTFRCILHKEDYFRHDYAGFFWASYIHQPADKNIYFKGTEEGENEEKWISAFSEEHGINSTRKGMNDQSDLFFVPGFRAGLASNFSDYRYSEPFYFGRFHNMALAFFFESDEIIRFTQSPTGGGKLNPAWDFQYIIPRPETGKEYSFKARLVYKPFAGKEDIEEEYMKWKKRR
jgi:hypothetical protein